MDIQNDNASERRQKECDSSFQPRPQHNQLVMTNLHQNLNKLYLKFDCSLLINNYDWLSFVFL